MQAKIESQAGNQRLFIAVALRFSSAFLSFDNKEKKESVLTNK